MPPDMPYDDNTRFAAEALSRLTRMKVLVDESLRRATVYPDQNEIRIPSGCVNYLGAVLIGIAADIRCEGDVLSTSPLPYGEVIQFRRLKNDAEAIVDTEDYSVFEDDEDTD